MDRRPAFREGWNAHGSMTYRDDRGALRARIDRLEAELAEARAAREGSGSARVGPRHGLAAAGLLLVGVALGGVVAALLPPTIASSVALGGALVVGGLLVGIGQAVRLVPPGHALVIQGPGGRGPRVTFEAGGVFPFIHQATLVDLRAKRIDVFLRGSAAPATRDGGRVDVHLACYVKVNRTREDVLRVLETAGDDATSVARFEELFAPKFREATCIVLAQVSTAEAARDRERIKEQVVQVIGRDLNGYVLDDLAIVDLEPVGTSSPSGG